MTDKKKFRLALAAACFGAACMLGTLQAAAEGGESAELNSDTVEYSTKTGIVTATGNVVMKRGNAIVTGAKAVYNSQTQEGTVSGNVVADKEDLHVTAQVVTTDGQKQMLATGGVHAVKADKTFTGEQVDYYPENEYVLIKTGGTVTSKDGRFTADYMEGWLNDERFKGVGNAHLVSPPKNLEAGGDQLDYFGKETGKAVLTGHAWAIQDNNTLKSNVLTIYLAEDGTANVE